MDGELKYVHVVWISAIPAGMTVFPQTCVKMNAARGNKIKKNAFSTPKQLKHFVPANHFFLL